MNITNAIAILDKQVMNPSAGLPEELFLFITQITPMVNVDLLVKDENGRTLLIWRNDQYTGEGWHIPGGIIRYKETIAERIQAVAKSELGAKIEFQAIPLAINEMIHPERRERGHFISLLYTCSLITSPDEGLRYISGVPRPQQWMWHDNCPENIIDVHEIYRQFI